MPDETLLQILFVGLVYFVAGTIKGTIGLGLPTTAITLMSFLLSPLQALAINLFPMFVANLWQCLRADNFVGLIKRYGVFAASLSVTILCGSFFTIYLNAAYLSLFLATAVILFAIYNLVGSAIRLSQAKDTQWQILFGFLAGVMGALTSMWAVPLVIYLLSLNLEKKAFVDAAGFLLLIGCVPLSVGYVASGLVTEAVIWPALMGAVCAIVGFRLGEVLRQFINAGMFRKLLLWFFLIMGVRMAVLALTTI